MAKNTSENQVAPLILKFLTDDVKYGYLNAELQKMLTEDRSRDKIETRMREFVKNHRTSSSPCSRLNNIDKNYNNVDDINAINQMPRQSLLKNVSVPNK